MKHHRRRIFAAAASASKDPVVRSGRKRSGPRRETTRADRRALSGRITGNRVAAAGAGVALVAMLAAGAAWAGTIIGTPKGDVLKGSPRNDKIYGKTGNDRLYGYGGNDLLVGGPGADLLACGAGRDIAIADKTDRVGRDCEVVRGLPKPPPPVDNSGLYISLGASAAAGVGATSPRRRGSISISAIWLRMEAASHGGRTSRSSAPLPAMFSTVRYAEPSPLSMNRRTRSA